MTRPTWNGIELPGFLVTNEKDIELFLNQLRKEKDRPRLNTIDAYVATTHALRFAVESTAREFYLMDIDEQVIDFQLFLKQMVLYSQGSLQNANTSLSGNLERARDELSSGAASEKDLERLNKWMNPGMQYPVYGFHIAAPIDITNISGIWNHLKNVPHSVFSDEGAFYALFRLYSENRVHLINGPLNHPETAAAFEAGKKLHHIYLSNIEYYLFRDGSITAFRDFIKKCAQSSEPDASVFRTVSCLKDLRDGARKGFIPDIETLCDYATRLDRLGSVVAVSDEELMRLSDIIRSKDKVPHPEVAARHLLASGTYQRDESLKSRYRFR